MALIAFAVLLAVTGPHLASLYAASGLAWLPARQLQPARQQLPPAGGLHRPSLRRCTRSSIILIALTPAVTGLFWDAPLLARELETGTFALAWNQSVTRARWLAVKL